MPLQLVIGADRSELASQVMQSLTAEVDLKAVQYSAAIHSVCVCVCVCLS